MLIRVKAWRWSEVFGPESLLEVVGGCFVNLQLRGIRLKVAHVFVCCERLGCLCVEVRGVSHVFVC